MKLKKFIKSTLKVLVALFIVLFFFYYYIGGVFLGGLTKNERKPISKECEQDIIQACHIVMPENAVIAGISTRSWGGNVHYVLIEVEGVDDPNEFVELNKDNYIKEYEEMGEKINVINGTKRLSDKISLYPTLKYFPNTGAINVLYDDEHIYLSIDSLHIYAKDVYKALYKYE